MPDLPAARRPLAFLPLLLLLGAASPSRVPAPAESGPGADAGHVARSPATEDFLVAAVSRERAIRTVHELVALGPRMGGTASGDRAADYVKRRLEDMGLAVDVAQDPPRDVHEEISWEARLVAPEAGPLDAWPCGFSPSLASIDLEVRDSQPADGGGAGAKRWALITARPPAEAFLEARSSGASAFLSDHPRKEGRYLDWAPATELPARNGSTIPGWTLSLNAGKKIRGFIEAGVKVRVRLALEARSGPGRPRTVIATLPGPSAGWYLVCAHGDSDSGGPGADDNASGVASLLETAAALSGSASRGMLPARRPRILFAVWGSEDHSTRAFIHDHAAGLSSLLGVFNFDQTGVSTEAEGLYFEGNDVPWNAGILRALAAAASARAGRDGFPRASTTNPSLGGTDASIFLPRKYGGPGLVRIEVPSTTIFTSAWGKPMVVPQARDWRSPVWPEKEKVTIDYDPFYHSSGDVPERTTDLHPDNVARCARAAALAIYKLMADAAEPSAPARAPRPPAREG